MTARQPPTDTETAAATSPTLDAQVVEMPTRRHLVSNSRSLFHLVEGELHRCSVLRRRSVDLRDHLVCRLLSGRVATVVPVHLLGRTLRLNIPQLDLLSINRGRLV